MTAGHVCPRCTRPAHGTTICDDCATDLAQALRRAIHTTTDLEVMLARQTRFAEQVGTARSAEKPLPLDMRASAAAATLRNAITTWTRVLLEDTTPPTGTACTACLHPACLEIRGPSRHTAGCARWLLLDAQWFRIRAHPAAAEMCDDIIGAVTEAIAVVDAPRSRRIRCGPCPELDEHQRPCRGDVWARVPARDIAAIGEDAPRLVCSVNPEHVWENITWKRIGIRIVARRAQLAAERLARAAALEEQRQAAREAARQAAS